MAQPCPTTTGASARPNNSGDTIELFSEGAHLKVRRVLTYITMPLWFALMGWGMCSLAGTWDLPFVWSVFGAQLVITLVGYPRLDPGMLEERRRPPKGQDKDPLGRLVLTVLILAHFWLAAKDIGKWHMSTNVPVALQAIAVVLVVIGWSGLYWSMAINKFFSSAIRLQSDRGQTVVMSGPYKWIRHPGYSFISLAFVSEGVAFGSWISVLPAIAVAAYLAYRTTLEEKLLTNDLPGYKEYAQEVRYRWLPGVW